MAQRWTTENIPDQRGNIAIITGANSGVGFEAARALAQKGALVVMACRNEGRGNAAAEAIRREDVSGTVEMALLDLGDLSSVRRFAESFAAHHPKVDILLNNAGVMWIPYRQTVDGFEMTFGINHLGHFALTGLLLPVIARTPQARVVTVSSGLHHSGQINFADLNATANYDKGAAYSQTKLANLLFAYELERKLEQHGFDAISVGAHPGYAATNLQFVGPQMESSRLRQMVMSLSNRLFAQSAAMGALPLLYAATAAGVKGGEYFGPDGMGESRGYPQRVSSSAESHDQEVARRLWAVSEEMTGVHYDFEAAKGGDSINSPSAQRDIL